MCPGPFVPFAFCFLGIAFGNLILSQNYVKYLPNSEVRSTEVHLKEATFFPVFWCETCKFCSNGDCNSIYFIKAFCFSLFLAGGSSCCLLVAHFEQLLEIAGNLLAPCPSLPQHLCSGGIPLFPAGQRAYCTSVSSPHFPLMFDGRIFSTVSFKAYSRLLSPVSLSVFVEGRCVPIAHQHISCC